MSYTTATLISKAFTLSGIVSREFNVVSGDQESEGLQLLNSMLAIKSANLDFIPYYQEFDLTAVIGQELYFIPNLVTIESFTFNIGEVRYATIRSGRDAYFATGRVDNIDSLPFKWRAERALGGTNLYIYFNPSQEFPLKIWGKFSLSNVTLDQDLSLTLDLFYIEYLRYELAQYICSEYNVVFQSESSDTLKKYRKVINQISPPDMSMQKISSFTGGNISWAYVNLAKGWWPN